MAAGFAACPGVLCAAGDEGSGARVASPAPTPDPRFGDDAAGVRGAAFPPVDAADPPGAVGDDGNGARTGADGAGRCGCTAAIPALDGDDGRGTAAPPIPDAEGIDGRGGGAAAVPEDEGIDGRGVGGAAIPADEGIDGRAAGAPEIPADDGIGARTGAPPGPDAAPDDDGNGGLTGEPAALPAPVGDDGIGGRGGATRIAPGAALVIGRPSAAAALGAFETFGAAGFPSEKNGSELAGARPPLTGADPAGPCACATGATGSRRSVSRECTSGECASRGSPAPDPPAPSVFAGGTSDRPDGAGIGAIRIFAAPLCAPLAAFALGAGAAIFGSFRGSGMRTGGGFGNGSSSPNGSPSSPRSKLTSIDPLCDSSSSNANGSSPTPSSTPWMGAAGTAFSESGTSATGSAAAAFFFVAASSPKRALARIT